MAQGVQCWDASGNIILDVTDRLTRVLGTVTTNKVNGSITDLNLLTGIPWFTQIIKSDGTTIPAREWWATFIVSVSGSELSWKYIYSNYKLNYRIVYGVM